MATIINGDGSRVAIDLRAMPLAGRLKVLQAIVGGFLETVSVGSGQHLLYWEDAKRMGKQPNHHATAIAGAFLMVGDYIAGPAVLATQAELDA